MEYIFSKDIIRSYDIRGIFGQNLNPIDAFHLAIKLSALRKKRGGNGIIVIGYDGRLSSIELHNSLIEGFQYSDGQIFDLGLVPTPALYFAAHYFHNVDIAVMITGSHNASEYNGFKIIVNGESIHDEDLKSLSNLEVGDLELSSNNPISYDITKTYLASLNKNIKAFNIVWDPASGAACNLLKLLVKEMPGNHLIINDQIDGHFPAHPPDPSKKDNLLQLTEMLRGKHYDFGIAFDGDADRLGVVTAEGQILFGSHLLLIFAYDLLQRKPGSIIITDSKMSNVVLEKIRQWSGIPIRYKTGHALIKAEMKRVNALLAGEMSGHLFFAEDYYGFDDAIFGACQFLRIASHYPNLISDVIQIMDTTISAPEIVIDSTGIDRIAFMNAIKKYLRYNSIFFTELDGIRVEINQGWFLIRASNTENIITAIAEASNPEELHEISLIMKKALAISSNL